MVQLLYIQQIAGTDLDLVFVSRWTYLCRISLRSDAICSEEFRYGALKRRSAAEREKRWRRLPLSTIAPFTLADRWGERKLEEQERERGER